MGHIARNCTKAGAGFGGSYGGGFGGGGAGKTCYSCGGYGHMSRKNYLHFVSLVSITNNI
jgi:cellular nucleic acid-binding protein